MTDKTDSKERADFEAHCRKRGANEATLSRWVDDGGIPPAMVGKYITRSVQDAWLAFQAGRASLAANAGSEPVAWRIDWPDEPELGHYFSEAPTDSGRCQPLYLHPSPPEGMMGGWIAEKEPPCKD